MLPLELEGAVLVDLNHLHQECPAVVVTKESPTVAEKTVQKVAAEAVDRTAGEVAAGRRAQEVVSDIPV